MISDSIYNEIIAYTKAFIHNKAGSSDKIEAIEIVHNLIVDEKFSADNWKHLVQKYYFQIIKDLRIEYVDIEDINHKVIHKTEDLWRCEKCGCDQPKSLFRLSWRLCDKCYRDGRKDKTREINRKSKAKNKDKYQLKVKQWRLENKEHISNYMKIYRTENKDHLSSYIKKYKSENKEKIKLKSREYYLKTKK
ncbi:hypothetical protein U9K52_09965 [Chryseobacterium sp. MHB01]|uniref:hypothetical protein n=1 Tax=Chryseobacterium sp. MHB01 TaxID=3109433 RepID=UPI002AFF4F42|nr:hypothetical protein [Chryseobacterium sp. MHB01]MEA1849238.1 hypothetical protein [Chryseobacterium sp. MHB01]